MCGGLLDRFRDFGCNHPLWDLRSSKLVKGVEFHLRRLHPVPRSCSSSIGSTSHVSLDFQVAGAGVGGDENATRLCTCSVAQKSRPRNAKPHFGGYVTKQLDKDCKATNTFSSILRWWELAGWEHCSTGSTKLRTSEMVE